MSKGTVFAAGQALEIDNLTWLDSQTVMFETSTVLPEDLEDMTLEWHTDKNGMTETWGKAQNYLTVPMDIGVYTHFVKNLSDSAGVEFKRFYLNGMSFWARSVEVDTWEDDISLYIDPMPVFVEDIVKIFLSSGEVDVTIDGETFTIYPAEVNTEVGDGEGTLYIPQIVIHGGLKP